MDNCPAFSTDKYDNEIRRTLPYYEEIYRQVAYSKIWKRLFSDYCSQKSGRAEDSWISDGRNLVAVIYAGWRYRDKVTG